MCAFVISAHRDASTMSAMPGDNPVFNSFYSLGQPGYGVSSLDVPLYIV